MSFFQIIILTIIGCLIGYCVIDRICLCIERRAMSKAERDVLKFIDDGLDDENPDDKI